MFRINNYKEWSCTTLFYIEKKRTLWYNITVIFGLSLIKSYKKCRKM